MTNENEKLAFIYCMVKMSRINDKVVKQIQERLTNDFEIKMFLPGVSPKSRGAFASGLRSI
jgi:hypothetical protein